MAFQTSRTRLFSSVSVVPNTTDSPDFVNLPEEKDTLLSSASLSTPTAATETPEIEPKEITKVSAEQLLESKDIQSRPVPGGNWKVDDPLGWTRNFGRRSQADADRLAKLARLQPSDEGYVDVSNYPLPPQVTAVRNQHDAEIVMQRLMSADPSLHHACDTEVMDIDLKSVGPVGNGYVTCVSVYSGPDFDYGLGDGPGTVLWIDNLDDAFGVLQYFKEWFEDERFLKVWHNYGFDRHVMWNEGIDVRGFGGDTMHMARLQDTSRARSSTGNGYSLEALTAELLRRRKRPMKEIFGVKRLRKDGSEGSLVDIPPLEVMQRDPKYRSKWIGYSCYDAKGTYEIREKLQGLLESMAWVKGKNLYDYYQMHMRPFGEVLTDMERRGIRVDARDYLAKVELTAREDRARHSQTFREWAATQIGPDGLALNPASSVQLCTLLFGGAKNPKTDKSTEKVRVFKVPREEIEEEALEAYRKRDEEANACTEEVDNKDELDYLDKMKAVQLKALCKERGLKISGKKVELQQRLREHYMQSPKENDEFESMSLEELQTSAISRGLSMEGTREELLEMLRKDTAFTKRLLASAPLSEEEGYPYAAMTKVLEEAAKSDGGALAEYLEEMKQKAKTPSKFIEVRVPSLGLEPKKYTAGGAPSVTADVIRKLAGDPFADPPNYGSVSKQGYGKRKHTLFLSSNSNSVPNS